MTQYYDTYLHRAYNDALIFVVFVNKYFVIKQNANVVNK